MIMFTLANIESCREDLQDAMNALGEAVESFREDEISESAVDECWETLSQALVALRGMLGARVADEDATCQQARDMLNMYAGLNV